MDMVIPLSLPFKIKIEPLFFRLYGIKHIKRNNQGKRHLRQTDKQTKINALALFEIQQDINDI